MADASTPTPSQSTLPASVADTLAMLGRADYVADRSLATAVHLALHLKRPLFLEGEAGVGKTEIAKVLSTSLKRRLIRLQCYEGLDVASAVSGSSLDAPSTCSAWVQSIVSAMPGNLNKSILRNF